jgi:hypothetical protein
VVSRHALTTGEGLVERQWENGGRDSGVSARLLRPTELRSITRPPLHALTSGGTQTTCLLALAALWVMVSMKKDTERTVTVEEKDMSTGDEVKKEYTVQEYDRKQLLTNLGKLALQVRV